jgi:hypothetical protein
MRTSPWFAAALVLGTVLAGATASRAEDAAQPAAAAGGAGSTAQPTAFSSVQLEQLVGPIALYPDSLLTHILMASTYPLEIVEASRWLKKNPSLKDSALEEALKEKDWDPSVKSVCAVPAVVEMMNENLDWMKDLGDAFLGQQAEVLAAAQRMRAKAYEAGNLKSSEQQVVTVDEEKVIVIEPAKPEVIYVPSYSPTVVYGGWQYPTYSYPTMYVPPPPGVGFMTFTAGVVWGAAIVGHADWHNHGVYGGPPPPRPGGPPGGPRPGGPPPGGPGAQRPGGPPPGGPGGPGGPKPGGPPGGSQGQAWQHNPEHRKGVNYQNSATAQKYGGTGASNQVTRDQARGRSGQQPAKGGGPVGASRDVSSRPSGSSGGAASRPTTSDRSYSSSGGTRNSAYSGSRSPSVDTSASSRGASSRGMSSYSGSASRSSSSASRPSGGGSRPSGGGSRPSGGGGRGGGRR